MADTQTTIENEQRRETVLDPNNHTPHNHPPHDRVEVFDTNGSSATQRQPIDNAQKDAGFGNADLHRARVIGGDAESTTFRPTDLRDSELNTTPLGNTTPAPLNDAGQGTNWGTILMVIALILLIILIGSWIF